MIVTSEFISREVTLEVKMGRERGLHKQLYRQGFLNFSSPSLRLSLSSFSKGLEV